MNRSSLFMLVLLCALGAGAWWLFKQQTVHQETDNPANPTMTLVQAVENIKTHTAYLNDQYRLQLPADEIEKIAATAKVELIKHASGADDNSTITVKDVDMVRKENKQQLKFRFPKKFEAKVTDKGLITRKLAKDRIKAEVVAMLSPKADAETVQKQWKTIKEDIVLKLVAAKLFLDEAGTPVVTEKDFNEMMKEIKQFTKEHFIQAPQPVTEPVK